jgi:hypothetical protein
MGKDPGTPNMGAVVMGHPNVLIGGFPMINIPNPVNVLLGKLSRLKGKPKEEEGGSSEGVRGGWLLTAMLFGWLATQSTSLPAM